MHRKPLLQMLERYITRYPEEGEMIARIRELVDSSPDCFERTCRPGHVTGSAWVLSADRSRCLLVHHAKLDRWLQPGGHADGDPNISEVALREVSEETGILDLTLPETDGALLPLDVDVHWIPSRYNRAGEEIDDAHEHHDIRFLVVAESEELVLSDESHDLGWFTHEEVLARTDEESVLRMLRKAGPN